MTVLEMFYAIIILLVIGLFISWGFIVFWLIWLIKRI